MKRLHLTALQRRDHPLLGDDGTDGQAGHRPHTGDACELGELLDRRTQHDGEVLLLLLLP